MTASIQRKPAKSMNDEHSPGYSNSSLATSRHKEACPIYNTWFPKFC